MVAGARNELITTANVIVLKFEILGRSRWPFGYEVLRGLSYPDHYNNPSKERPASVGWGGARY